MSPAGTSSFSLRHLKARLPLLRYKGIDAAISQQLQALEVVDHRGVRHAEAETYISFEYGN